MAVDPALTAAAMAAALTADGATPAPPSFCDYLHQHVGANWVLAHRTQSIVRRYGEDVVCLTAKAYKALERNYERLTGLAAHGAPGEPARSITANAGALLAALRDLAHVACCDPDGDASDRAAFETIHTRAMAVIAAAEDRL